MATFETYPVINPYARLGLRPGAPLAEVKRAYRRLGVTSPFELCGLVAH